MEKRPFYRKVRQTLHETVSDSGKSILCYRGNNDKIYYVASSNDPNIGPGGGMIEVTWQELKNKRDSGELIPGCLYRITDYQCTTTQENTKSAGHQFDIVLLALSENKLAEEGWAMMHDNIYDVTFDDGVTKKCYFYITGEDTCNLVDIDTLLGVSEVSILEITVDKNTKTIQATGYGSDYLNEENLTYNYFQNSNLSAWKVWYCLDNDKSRFAWADDSVDEGTPAFITEENSVVYYRDVLHDSEGSRCPYAWTSSENVTKYTLVLEPSGRVAFVNNPNPSRFAESFVTYTPASEGTGLPNGRGVIYRLIDEFNNDIKYDFKNIQFKRTITDGQYDARGDETWCYTLNVWYNNMCQDASIVGNILLNDEEFVTGVYDNNFGYATAYNLYLEGVNTFAYALGNNVVLSINPEEYYGIYSNTIGDNFYSNTIGEEFHSNIIGNSCRLNTIGNVFCNNIVGNDFDSNTIGDGFVNNIIGNIFSNNTISYNVATNMIGNNFVYKTISNNTSYKNYGSKGVELATKNDLN